MKDIEDVMKYLVPVSKEIYQRKLDEKLKSVKKFTGKFDISDEVGKFYDCEASGRSINGKHISPPAGSRPLDRELSKIGFSGYDEFLGYDEEIRDGKIEDLVKDWVTYVDRERYRELSEELADLDIELPEFDRFPELGRSFKNKMEELDRIGEELKDIYRNWKRSNTFCC